MSMKPPIDLKSLIFKTAASRGEPETIEVPFGDEFTVDNLNSSEIKEEATRGAKLWMASAKYVTPAASVATAITQSNEQGEKLLDRKSVV